MDNLKKELELDVHKVEPEVLCKRFSTDLDSGLSEQQVKENQAQYGPNALTPPKTTPEWIKFCKCLFSGFAMLLWVGAILCFVAYTIQVYKNVKNFNRQMIIFDELDQNYYERDDKTKLTLRF